MWNLLIEPILEFIEYKSYFDCSCFNCHIWTDIFYKGKKMYKNAPSKYLGSGMATAGLITSIIGLVLGLFFVYYAFLRVRF